MKAWNWTKKKARKAGYAITGKTPTQKLVLEATNSDKWGTSNTKLNQIAQLSHSPLDYNDIMAVIWARIDDHELRHTQKTMILIEYLLKNGAEQIRSEVRGRMSIMQMLAQTHIHEVGEDAALEAVVRKKAENIMELVNDNNLYKMEREKCQKLRDSLTAVSNVNDGLGFGAQITYGNSQNPNYSHSNSIQQQQQQQQQQSQPQPTYGMHRRRSLNSTPQQPYSSNNYQDQQQQQQNQYQNQQQNQFAQQANPFQNQQQQQNQFDQQANPFQNQQQQQTNPFQNQQPQQQNQFDQQANPFQNQQQQSNPFQNQQQQQANPFQSQQQQQQSNPFQNQQQQSNPFQSQQQQQQSNPFQNQQPQQQQNGFNLFANQQPQQPQQSQPQPQTSAVDDLLSIDFTVQVPSSKPQSDLIFLGNETNNRPPQNQMGQQYYGNYGQQYNYGQQGYGYGQQPNYYNQQYRQGPY